MTAKERAEAAMKMLSVISDRDITPGDVQAICLSVMTSVYAKAGAPKHMAPVIASDIAKHAMFMLYGALPEEGGEE